MELHGTSFVIEEFVPPITYGKWGNRSTWFINMKVVLFSQWLKDRCGDASVTINDWKWGGPYQYSGYRPPDCDIGAKESSHKRGLAIDVKVKGWHPDRIRKLIKDNFKFLNEKFEVSGYELDTPTWTHIDFRWTNSTVIYEIPIPK